MLTDIKLSKAHLPKIVQSGAFLDKKIGNVMGSLDKKAPTDLIVSLAKDV